MSLSQAIYEGDKKLVEKLLDSGVYVDTPGR